MLQNDIFNFVAVRPPQKIDSSKKGQRFIYDKRPPGGSKILQTIIKAMRSNVNREKIISLVKEIIQNSNYSADYPQGSEARRLKDVERLVRKNISDFNLAKLQQDIKKILGRPVADFVKTQEYISTRDNLWDRLYCFYILNTDEPQDLEPLISDLRILHVLDYLSAHSTSLKNDKLRTTYYSAPLMPEPLFHLPKKQDKKGSANIGIKRIRASTELEIADELVKTKETIKEIQAFPLRIESPFAFKEKKSKPISDFDSEDSSSVRSSRTIRNNLAWVLSKESASKLSNNATAYLKDEGIDPESTRLPDLVELLEEKQGQLMSRILLTRDPKVIEKLEIVKKTVPEIEPLLAIARSRSMDGNGMTTTGRAREFLTFPEAGSLRPLGIGDLKVVKQTLKRYDAGEVAHIENVLKGESKKGSIADLTELKLQKY